jgi:type VI secretion system protein ImpA
VPDFDRLTDFLNQVCGVFEKARPEFAGDAGVATPQEPETANGGTAAAASGPAAATAPAGSVAVSSRSEAAAALAVAEAYFAKREPSAPALILVHQARMLIGKSLVEAIETLLPEAAEQAIIRFEPELKFQIAMPHMRTLTQQAVGDGAGEMDGAGGEPSFQAESRTEAAALISAVDAYFRVAEPSSPVPMLLSKARTYLNRDFTLILNDLLQQPAP